MENVLPMIPVLALLACSRAAPPSTDTEARQEPASRTETAAVPSTITRESVPERYRKTPVLALVEAYALSTIGELSPDKDSSVREVVKTSFGGGDDWRATLRQRLGWPKEIDDNILLNWSNYQRAAVAAGAKPTAVDFAHTFGDEFVKH